MSRLALIFAVVSARPILWSLFRFASIFALVSVRSIFRFPSIHAAVPVRPLLRFASIHTFVPHNSLCFNACRCSGSVYITLRSYISVRFNACRCSGSAFISIRFNFFCYSGLVYIHAVVRAWSILVVPGYCGRRVSQVLRGIRYFRQSMPRVP